MVDLFSKRRSDNGLPARRRLKDFDDEEYSTQMKGPLSMVEDERAASLKSSPLDELIKDSRVAGVGEKGEIMARFDDMQDEMNRIDSDIASLRKEYANARGRLQKLEDDVDKLGTSSMTAPREHHDRAEKRGPIEEPPPRTHVERMVPEATEHHDSGIGHSIPRFRPFSEGETEQEEELPRAPEQEVFIPEQTSQIPPTTVPQLLQADTSMPSAPGAPPSARPVKGSILTRISSDYLTLVLVVRWIEFLFERVTRDKISLVLDYYVEVGWISEGVKSQIMSIARGEMQDVTKLMVPEETREEAFGEIPAAAPYKKVEDWRLSADDHLKSLLFIQKIAGLEVDKDRLNSLEQTISRFKESLEGYHGI